MRYLVITIVLPFLLAKAGVSGCYTSILSFGDSLADTGNRLFYDRNILSSNPPYGETYFRRPTGRSSNGRLVIDFIAQALGLPLVPTYFGHTVEDFQHGVNFAVGGATAVEASFYWERGIPATTNYSLAVQLGWFRELLPSLCNSSSNCRSLFQNALVLMGEIGGNDYNHPLLARRNIQEIRTFVPRVIATVSSSISELINEGAVTLLVPGNIPIGCLPAYLTIYESKNASDYDPSTGCLNWLNEFSQFHNLLLQNELYRLRQLHPCVTIIYVDYYKALMDLYRSPQLGFKDHALQACCGAGGQYNFNAFTPCSRQGASACDDPSLYVSWDGYHLTESAYNHIAIGMLESSILCVSLKSHKKDLSASGTVFGSRERERSKKYIFPEGLNSGCSVAERK